MSFAKGTSTGHFSDVQRSDEIHRHLEARLKHGSYGDVSAPETIGKP
jgi:hypothetical protein